MAVTNMYSQVIGRRRLRRVKDGSRRVGRVAARLRRPADAQRVVGVGLRLRLLAVDLLVVAHFVLYLLPLLLGHPTEFDR